MTLGFECDLVGSNCGRVVTPFPWPYPPPTSVRVNNTPCPRHPKGCYHTPPLPPPPILQVSLRRHHNSCTRVAGPTEGKRSYAVVALAAEVHVFSRIRFLIWRGNGTLYRVKLEGHGRMKTGFVVAVNIISSPLATVKTTIAGITFYICRRQKLCQGRARQSVSQPRPCLWQ